jgi:hypothetical protein
MKAASKSIIFATLVLAAGIGNGQESLDLDALLGTWNMTYDMGQGQETGTITISRNDDGDPMISMSTSGGGASNARDIEIDGDTLTYTRDVNAQGQSLSVNYTAKLMEGKLEGSFELDLGGVGGAGGLGGPTAWTATKAE